MLTTPIKKIQQSISLTKLLRIVMFGRCASNSNATIRALLVIECVDHVMTLGRFSFDFRLMGYYSRFGRRRGGSSERAAGELLACRRRARTSENSTLYGEGLSRALSGTGNSGDATGEKERSGTRTSGRVGKLMLYAFSGPINDGRSLSAYPHPAAKGQSGGVGIWLRVASSWDSSGTVAITEYMGACSFSAISTYCEP